MKGLPNKPRLRLGEVATFLGRHPRTVKRMILDGTLPGEKIGGGWLVPRDALIQYVRGRRSDVLLGVQYEFEFDDGSRAKPEGA